MQYYKNPYGNVFGNSFPTPIGRLQFVALSAPQEFGGKSKFGVTLLFEKANYGAWISGFSGIQEDINGMITQEYGETIPDFKYPMLRDGDEQKYNGFPGAFYIKATAGTNQDRVAVYDAKGNPIDPVMPVAGMRARCVIRPGLFADGVNYRLVAVQLMKDDGVRYSKAPSPLSFLDPIAEEETEGGVETIVEQVANPVMQAAARPVVAAPMTKPSVPASPVVAAPVSKPTMQVPMKPMVPPQVQRQMAANPAPVAQPAAIGPSAVTRAAASKGLSSISKLNGMV